MLELIVFAALAILVMVALRYLTQRDMAVMVILSRQPIEALALYALMMEVSRD